MITKRGRSAKLLATMGVVAAVGATLSVTAPAAQATIVLSGFGVVFQSSTGNVATLNPDGSESDLSWTMDPTSSPSVTADISGSSVVAFKTDNGLLGRMNLGSGVLQFDSAAVAPHTSPAIVVDSSHKIRTVFQNDGVVKQRISNNDSTTLGGSVAPNTSPATAWNLITGLNKTVYVDSSGYLSQFVNGAPSRIGVGLAVASGTSPSVAAGTLDSEIAYNGAGGDLTIYKSSDASVNDTGEAITSGTNPSIAALATGGFVAAYVNNGTLHILDASGFGHDTGLAMAPGSSPAIAADNSDSGYRVIFGDASRHVSTYFSNGVSQHSNSVMRAGTSPAITASTAEVVSCIPHPGCIIIRAR